ncbi:putative integral membrane peptide transporter [Kockovaella imperatae]|uniref:Putative integral membrane peptide transporter n=1 Tax=Kockovaella imperatae TaxID=4999 RepID=A0A1Y1UQC2_9TREE|nr:putative integral membrane peptide transporter [Kockovaella imperatae]ORX40241.1 putative integral membrane peptide transporter [Kockovaella imperatae]
MSAAHTNVVADVISGPVPAEAVPQDHDVVEERKEEKKYARQNNDQVVVGAAVDLHDSDEPTDEEYKTLRKVPAGMKWACIAMCTVELAERASYYGCQQIFANFVNNPLPDGGNGAGAVAKGAAGLNQSAGALGMGSVAATAVGQTFTFLAYTIPILGGILSDTRWGRFKTLCVGVAIGALSHVLLVIPAIPKVLAEQPAKSHAFPAFMIILIILAFASGMIKPCLGPMLCDQSPVKRPTIITTKKGERVILDPQTTIARYFLIFYWCINVGSFFGLATSYAERFVGFWLAFLTPGIVYMIVPVVLVIASKSLYKAPPQGSVVLESLAVMREIFRRGGLRKIFKPNEFWILAKPSHIAEQDGGIDTHKVFWDDRFVDEIRQSYAASAVFFLIPVFLLADGGIGNAENDMSTAMVLNGIPNDVFNNFNPLAIIVATPILTYGLYPFMEKIGYPLKPMTRMCIGFLLGGANMVIGAIVQKKIYATSPCGDFATNCPAGVSTVSVAWLIPLYTIPAVGELFVLVTSYELAYTRSPARMKGLVYAICLSNSAVAAIVGLASAAAIVDPYLTNTYIVLAALCFFLAPCFPIFFKHLDQPMFDFQDRERMEGKHQQDFFAKHAQQEDGELAYNSNHGRMEDISEKV